jgi:hypothetical protein
LAAVPTAEPGAVVGDGFVTASSENATGNGSGTAGDISTSTQEG